MLQAGIADGEYVIVDPGIEPECGDIVLVSLDDRLVCKRLYRDGLHTVLMSDNPTYQPIEVDDFSNMILIGCVVSGFSLFKRKLVTSQSQWSCS